MSPVPSQGREPYPVTAMRSLPRLLLAALLAATLASCSKNAPDAEHLIFITVDTLRVDRLGCYGGKNPCSPAIDRLAAEGTKFDAAYVPRAVTLSSMATFFTSKYPTETAVINNMQKVRPDELLLAERLKDAKFGNRCWNASAVLKPASSGIDQGFDPQFYAYEANERSMSQSVVKYVKDKFGRQKKREFLWVHFMNPHRPYDPPPPYDRKFDTGYRGDIDGSTPTLDRIYIEKPQLPPGEIDHILALYDGQVAFVDQCIADIMKALDASGQSDSTLVVFAADHGEELFTHNLYPYHANSAYRSGTRIPLIFRQPGKVRAGAVITDLAESVDFVPTVLAWLNVDPNATKDVDSIPRGLDLGATLKDGAPIKRTFAFAQIDEDVFAVRTTEWSLISNPDEICPDGPPSEGEYLLPKLGLYRIPDDPDEQNNLLEQHHDVADNLLRAIDGWRAGLKRGRAEKNPNMQWAREMVQQGYLSGTGDSGTKTSSSGSGTIAPPASSPAKKRKNRPTSEERQADEGGG